MTQVIAFDTETTGLPDWKSPSGGDSQPHLVQLGAIRADIFSEAILEEMEVIIKPDGWIIPGEVAEIHGITTERAMDEGIPEIEALEQFMDMWIDGEELNLRVAHNRTFDQRIIRIAMMRYMTQADVDAWADKEDFDCTMLMAKPIMQLPPRGRYGYRNPKLEAALKHFTGEDLEDAHTALADTRACLKIWFAITNLTIDLVAGNEK